MIGSNLDGLAIAAVMITIGVLMLAHVVRGVPRSPTSGAMQDGVVLVATKSRKKSKGDG